MDKKLKYIFVVRQLGSGGAEMSTILLGQQLYARGHQIEIWNIGKWSSVDAEKWQYWATIKQISKYQLLFYKKKPNELLILVNNVGHKYTPTNNAISILHRDYIEDFEKQKSYRKKIKELLKIKFHYSKRQNIIISKLLAEKLQPFAIKPVIYIPNPFDANYVLKSSSEKMQYSLPQNFIVHVGRISYQKNQEYLLNEYLNNNELNSSVDLVFVGGETSSRQKITKKLQSIVEKHPLKYKVHFLGDVQNPFPIMKQAKCLVLCSRFESMGYVLLEAMTLNTPIVSTDEQGPKEVLGENFIGLVSKGESLSKKIIMALKHPNDYKAELPSEYEPQTVADRFENFTNQLKLESNI